MHGRHGPPEDLSNARAAGLGCRPMIPGIPASPSVDQMTTPLLLNLSLNLNLNLNLSLNLSPNPNLKPNLNPNLNLNLRVKTEIKKVRANGQTRGQKSRLPLEQGAGQVCFTSPS